jgi:hypothetical protein
VVFGFEEKDSVVCYFISKSAELLLLGQEEYRPKGGEVVDTGK